jgi:hypothetical protein
MDAVSDGVRRVSFFVAPEPVPEEPREGGEDDGGGGAEGAVAPSEPVSEVSQEEVLPPATSAGGEASIPVPATVVPAIVDAAPPQPQPKPVGRKNKLEGIMNSLENATGIDLDGDGDVGIEGVGAPPPPKPERRSSFFSRGSKSWLAADGSRKRGSRNDSRINELERKLGMNLDGDGDIGE